MNTPAPHSAIDDNRQGLIGKPIDRVDGRLKVMGQATYAHEVTEGGAAAFGFIVEATIARGTVADIDTTAAQRAPGVLLVMTHKNAPKQAAWGPINAKDRFARASPQLGSNRVAYCGQAVAFVVAQSFEAARLAARLVKIRYMVSPGDYELAPNLARAEKPADRTNQKTDSVIGDVDTALAASSITVDSTFTKPFQVHAQMEPHATVANWTAGRVTIHCAAQLLKSAQNPVANTLQILPTQGRIVSRYIGGGIGGKLPIYGDVMLSATAARQLNRPVKTALTGQQMFHFTTHRSSTIQRVRLGAGADSKLTAIAHDAWSHSARFDNVFESASRQTRALYAAPHRSTTHRSVKLDLPVADSTRAPGGSVGMLALEQAMDELAEKLAIDPIELRLRNEPALDIELGLAFSSRQLVACLRDGAVRFGWHARQAKPRAVTDGRWWVGVASAIRGNLLMASKCAVALDRQGVLTVRMVMTDIGTGSYTVFTQIAAEMLGLPIEHVRMQLSDSDLPDTPGSGGSWGAASAGSGLFDAYGKLRALLAHKLGVPLADAVFEGGRVSGAGRSDSLGVLAGTLGLEATGEIKPGAMAKQFSQQAYGAHFAEVGVNMDTGEIRLRRMLGVFAAGRILNNKTANRQAVGAMIWGVGELGICGAGAAVANAVYNACGVRIRDYPLTLDKVLAGLGAARAA